ncbi:MAG TPA: PIN domain-containing protein [Polyangia bacterium]|nr:PIN domain-containing protein [Polyangia bacterium]
MTRVFLDANVLFSAAWRAESGLLRFWKLPLVLVSSPYAITEAERNLSRKRPEALARLEALLEPIELVDALTPIDASGLPAKDVPILAAAVAGRCQVLVTGDVTDFGHVLGQTVLGVRVLTPSMLLAELAQGG